MSDQLDMFGTMEPERPKFVRHPDTWAEVDVKPTPEGELYAEALRQKWEAER